MSVRERIATLNRVQQGRMFKLVASVVVALITIGALTTVFVSANKDSADTQIVKRVLERNRAQAENPTYQVSTAEQVQATWDNLLTLALDPGGRTTLIVSGAAVLGAALAVIWLSLGLSYLALLIGGAAVAIPLALFPSTQNLGVMIGGLIPLAFAFLILLQLVRLVFNAPFQTFAIARNVINEGVRMKISLVFIVLIMIVLALVPTLLNQDQPLRYRVQQWLQYGTGISFGLLALLTAFFACATVAFEQRDRVIWQTMTKPVAPWRYILGKWLGVMALNAVLLTVVAAGSYLFTEFLRHQPAQGEIAYHVTEQGQMTSGSVSSMTEDRRILETQVLVARVKRPFDPPVLPPREQIEEMVEQRFIAERQASPDIVDNDATRTRIRTFILKEIYDGYRTVPPGGFQRYFFSGLGDIRANWASRVEGFINRVNRDAERRLRLQGEDPEAVRGTDLWEQTVLAVRDDYVRAGKRPIEPTLSLQYKINSGSNDPSKIFKLLLTTGHEGAFHQDELEVVLKQRQETDLAVALINPEDGKLHVQIASDPRQNFESFTFPPDGLQILYAKGSYTANFFRIMFVMWVKLGFIAAVAIACSTFLSFSVSCLCSLGVLFMAESASFLNESLDFSFTPEPGKLDIGNWIIQGIGRPIAWTFDTYTNLRPTQSLVDGLLVSWGDLSRGTIVIGAWTLVTLTIGVVVFRSRELATYSGH